MSDTVGYSDAQLRLLAAMELVPWVRRDGRFGIPSRGGAGPANVPTVVPPPLPEAPSEPAPTTAASTPSRAAQPPSAVRSGSGSAALPPAELAALGDWLATRPLAGFARRGERRYEQGDGTATLLVVAQPGESVPELLPLERAEQALLDAMLRAIDLERADVAIATLARDAAPDATAPTVAARLAMPRRALLWLARGATPAAADACRFTLAGLPAFAVPHPARLLVDPLGKRHAWEVLKRLRAALDPRSPVEPGSNGLRGN